MATLCLPLLLVFHSVALGDDANEAGVDQLINQYFDVWSAGDMDAYEQTFHPDAVIYFLTPAGGVHRFDVAPFVATQKSIKNSASVPSKEIPLEIKITTEGDTAHVRVLWELTTGAERRTGIDYFVLVRSNAGWRILSLIFLNL